MSPSARSDVVSGLVVGCSWAVTKWLTGPLTPYVSALMAARKAALIPVIVLVWGIGTEAVVITVVLYSVFAIIYNTIVGGAGGRNRLAGYGTVAWGVAPACFLVGRAPPRTAVPMILAGIKYAAVRAVKGLIIGEQLIAVVGLGALVMRYAGGFLIKETYVLVIFTGVSQARLLRCWACWSAGS